MIRIGIVGTGGMGTVHYTNYQYIKDCAVVAICGSQKKARAWNLPCYSDISQMARKEKLDIIDICTPTFRHHDQVIEALTFCHVICEKPLTLTRQAAQEMYEKAAETGHHLYVAHVLRFYPEYKLLEKAVRENAYGQVLDAYFWRLSAKPAWSSGGWMTDKSKSGLVPFDLHIHDLDFAVALFGLPKSVRCTKAQGPQDDMAQQYRFFYEFGDDERTIPICAEAAWFRENYTFSAGYRVCFEHAVMEARGGDAFLYREGREPEQLDTSEARKIPTGINVPPTGVYLEELEHFVSCVKRDTDSEKISQEQVLGVLEILENISAEL